MPLFNIALYKFSILGICTRFGGRGEGGGRYKLELKRRENENVETMMQLQKVLVTLTIQNKGESCGVETHPRVCKYEFPS